MHPDQFSPEMQRHLVRVPSGYWAFVPPPLPPDITFDARLTGRLSDADRAVGELSGVGRWLPNPHLLIGPFLRREAVLSSRIEGTVSTVTDLVLFEAAPYVVRGSADVREVANYVRAVEEALRPDRDLPISLRLIRRLHGILLSGTPSEHLTPGEFRRSQNWIGSPGSLLTDATFVPPPPDEMLACLDAFEKYLHAPATLPPLVRLALIHQQFEAIHPFLDGNGRIGRLLITVLLAEWDLLPQPLLYLSAFFEARRAEYYERLLAVNLSGAWEAWVEFFLEGVTEQALDVVERARLMFNLRESFRARLHAARGSALPLRLVDRLFETPAVTISQARDFLQVTPRAASLVVGKLVSAGVLREATGQARNRIFVAFEVLDVLQAPTSRLPDEGMEASNADAAYLDSKRERSQVYRRLAD
jgi:Fic family protein